MANAMIDLRSDTLTRPSRAMREAMAAAEVGDDVFGEDPTVNLLQERVAVILGKERALFVASGTMGNQLCIKTHTRAGDELIAEAGAHVFYYETAGAAFLSSVQVFPVHGHRGVLAVEEVRHAIRPDIYYMPKTRLLCLENTHNRAGGSIYPLDAFATVAKFAHGAGLKVHLDGARLWNACVATGVEPSDYCSHVDSVSVCLSKGLGAPVGSIIAGTKEFIDEARHFRKIFGGGMRQAGILAAAGLYALDNNIDRLAEDHEKAAGFAATVGVVPGVTIDMNTVQTNIVIMDLSNTGTSAGVWARRFEEAGVRVSQAGEHTLRAVTHLDVSVQQVRDAAATIVRCMESAGSR
jgi:threonine aldolase